MIDWFPFDTAAEPARNADDLLRWAAFADVARLARSVDLRSPETVGHSRRTAETAVALAGRLGWSGSAIALLREAALVHDVGKVAVSEEILNASGPLTDDERAILRTHARMGADIVQGALRPEQVEWVLHHHERHDGTGYPHGLRGDRIPEGARLLALADAWDAMTHRHRSGPLDMVAALEECVGHSGTQFAPAAVEALIDVWPSLPVPQPAAVVAPLRGVPDPVSSVDLATVGGERTMRF